MYTQNNKVLINTSSHRVSNYQEVSIEEFYKSRNRDNNVITMTLPNCNTSFPVSVLDIQETVSTEAREIIVINGVNTKGQKYTAEVSFDASSELFCKYSKFYTVEDIFEDPLDIPFVSLVDAYGYPVKVTSIERKTAPTGTRFYTLVGNSNNVIVSGLVFGKGLTDVDA